MHILLNEKTSFDIDYVLRNLFVKVSEIFVGDKY